VQQLRILVIDDSPFVYKAMKRAVEPHGHTVIGHAENGRIGLELISQLNPDIITLDVTMPVMDGLQVLQYLEKDKLDKVIMISAMGDMDLLKQAKGYGVHFFLNKPFQPENVINAINEIIKER
jgi:two-component system chemotaxis response regulator CheY